MASVEFQLVLEDLYQVIKLIYDVDPDKLDPPSNDDELFWRSIVRFLRKAQNYDEFLDKPLVSWW